MQTVVEGLGWPTSKPETSPGAQQWHTSPVLRGGSQRSAEDELRYQTLTLQVVSPAYSGHSVEALDLLRKARGAQHMTCIAVHHEGHAGTA